MPHLPNPNSNIPYEKVYVDKYGEKTHGERTIDGLTEIVDLKTGKSNMTYIQPEPVTHYEGCDHSFKILNIGRREVECSKCNYQLTFHVVENYTEENGNGYIVLNKVKYPLI